MNNEELQLLYAAYLQKLDNHFDIEAFLFKEQLDFVRDPTKFVTACCSVRSGKTTACAADLIDTALRMPGTTGLYITLARSSAERIVWPELKKINREYNLGGNPNESKLSFKFPNDSMIYLIGANDDAEIEKIRGLSNVALCYLDESQAFRSFIKELIEDIITKRLYDTNGRCRMIGTPGPVLSGYFYDCCQSDEWGHHSWTMHNNPWLQKKSGLTPSQLIEQDCKRKGVTIDDPSIQRECFGRWKLDLNSLLLSYQRELNHYEDLPKGKTWNYVLGVDLGQIDANFLTVLGFHDGSKVTYLIEEKQTFGQLTDDLGKDIKDMMAKYPMCRIRADAGGLGKAIVEDIKMRYGLPMEPADKAGKIASYALLNNALRTGNFKAKHDSFFAHDCNILEKDREKSTPEKIVVRGHSDSVDAALYAFRESPAYSYEEPPPKPKANSPEADQAFADAMFEQNMERLKRDKENKDGQGRNWVIGNDMVPDWNRW